MDNQNPLTNDNLAWTGIDTIYNHNSQKGTTNAADNLRGNFTAGIDNISGKIPTILTIAIIVAILGILVLLIIAYKKLNLGGGGI